MPFFIQSKGFLTACRNTAADCIIFLTVWNSWLRHQTSKILSLYKLSLSFLWNDEGKQAVKTKAGCFKAWRLFLFSSLFLSNMHYSPSVKSIRLDLWPNSFFSILLDFLKALYFFPGWSLCKVTSELTVHVKLYSKRARLLHSRTGLFHLFTHYLFMVHLAILKQAVAFSVFPNTTETPRNEAVYYRNLLSRSSLA